MGEHTEQALRGVVEQYESARAAALTARDAALRAFHDAGWPAVELQRVTGYSRETIRQALNPDARKAINRGRRDTAARLRIARQRFVIPRTMEELAGPATGAVTLPSDLQGESDATYDLSRARSVSRMYENVLFLATSVDDLRTWINADLLVRRWPDIPMPPGLRNLWERQFPRLGRRWSPMP
jgi:hypothetical protein